MRPRIKYPNSALALSGYALGMEDPGAVRVLFMRGGVEHVAMVGGVISRDPNEIQYIDIEVPEAITPGLWQLVVDVKGRRSAPVTIDIKAAGPVVLTRVSPERPHPSQGVLLATTTPAQAGDHLELIDGRGVLWRMGAGVSSLGFSFTLPDDVAEGEATVRAGRAQDGADRFSASLKFLITSSPLPLKRLAAAMMKSVAPGQWTDLVKDADVEFEIRRSDRIEVEFRQGDAVVITQATGPVSVHVQVPPGLAPGSVSVRTRTWIEQTGSEWSAPSRFRTLQRFVSPSISSIEAGPLRKLVVGRKRRSCVRPNNARGSVGAARTLPCGPSRRSPGATPTTDRGSRSGADGRRWRSAGRVPGQTAPGDWQLTIGTADGLTPLQRITTVRVM